MSVKGWLLPAVVNPATRCIQIEIPDEPRHIAAFYGALQQLAEWWNWERDEAHTATQVAYVWRLAVEAIHTAMLQPNGGCMAFQLRQSPEESCLLEQSFDGGGSWSTAFDFALCIPPATQTILDQVGALYNAGWQPNPFAPDDTWVHSDGDTTAESDGRAVALCYASKQAVGILCDALIGAYQGTITLVNFAEAVVSLVEGFAAILGGSVFAMLAGAVSFGALEWVENMIAADIAILEDADIRQFLACTLFQQLQARPVTLPSFVTAFDDDFSCRTADEQRAAEMMNGVLSVVETAQRAYQGFSDIMAQSTLAEGAALIPDCTCPTSAWTYCLPLGKWYEFSERFDATYTAMGNEVPFGECNDSLDLTTYPAPSWKSGLSTLAGEVQGLGRRMTMWVPSQTTVTAVSFLTSGTPPTYTYRIGANGSEAGIPPTLVGLSISGEELILEIEATINDNINAWVTEIRLTGTGVPLFGACDNCG